MKTKTKHKEEDAVIQRLRQIRDKINDEIKDLSPIELKDYFKKQITLHPKSFWRHGA